MRWRNETLICAVIAISFGSTPLAFAENCRALPFGPERKACAMREHPVQFQAKQERCERIALIVASPASTPASEGLCRVACVEGSNSW